MSSKVWRGSAANIRQMSSKVWHGSAASIRQMSRQVSRGSAGEYQEDEQAEGARLRDSPVHPICQGYCVTGEKGVKFSIKQHEAWSPVYTTGVLPNIGMKLLEIEF